MYQVLYRADGESGWATFSPPTSDPFAAMRLLQQAKARHEEATVVQASTPSELTLLVRRMLQRDGIAVEMAAAEPEAAPTGIPALQPAAHNSKLERRRWDIEQGGGGDRDQPYRFELPESAAVTTRWLHLLAQHQRAADASE